MYTFGSSLVLQLCSGTTLCRCGCKLPPEVHFSDQQHLHMLKIITLLAEINHRLDIGKVAFLRLQKAKVQCSRALTSPTKLHFLQSIVMSVLLRGVEAWTLLSKHLTPPSVLHIDCLGRMLGICVKNHVTDTDILSQCQMLSVQSQLRSKRLRWYRHVCRQAGDNCVMVAQVNGPGHVGKPIHVGKPRNIWTNVALSDIHHVPVSRPYQVAQT